MIARRRIAAASPPRPAKNGARSRLAAVETGRDSTREAILLAGPRIFHQPGYKVTTLRDLARVCNLKAGSIYYYFSSKEEIVGEILNRGMHNLIDNVRAAAEVALRKTSHRARIDAALRAHLRTLLDSPYAAANKRIFDQAPPPVRRRNQRLHDVYHDYWRALFAKAQAVGQIWGDINLSLLRLLIISTVNMVDQWLKPDRGPLAPDDLIRQFLLVLFEGMTPPAGQGK